MLLRALFVSAFLAPLILAQTESDANPDGLFADFPEQCKDSCGTMEGIVSKCSMIGDSEASEAESIACICNESFVNALQSCGSCVVPATGVESESGGTVAQIAIAVSKQCGLPVNIQGLSDDPRLSSILMSPSAASYSPTNSPSSAPTSQTDDTTTDTSSLRNSMTSSGSQTSTPFGTATSAPASAANSLKVGFTSLLLGTIGITLVLSSNTKIPNTGSLADRIAKLNLQNPSSSPSSSSTTRRSSSPPSPSAVRTGATTRISDKISRFQVNAEGSPLLPSGGSFGQAPSRPSGFKAKGAEKPRVASLGAGRASVPLDVVKPSRSVSTGNIGSRTASEAGSVGSGEAGSRSSTPSGSRAGSTYEPSSTPSTNVIPPTSHSPLPSLDKQFTNLLPPEPRTPGAMSVSSMNVETGSIASEGGRTASESELTPSLSTAALVEPPAFPTGDVQDSPVPIPPSSSSAASSDDIFPPPSTSPALATKGPLDALRQPSRSASIASMSSLVVEAPPDDVADLDAMSNSGRPATTSEPQPSGIVTPTADQDDEEEQENLEEPDERRLERTNEELTKYEADEEDPTAHGPGPESREGDRTELPVRPTWEADRDSSQDEKDVTTGEEESGMPKVRCHDCNTEVNLVELADHSCSPSRQAPPSLNAASSPQKNESSVSPSSSSRDNVDVPQEPVDDFSATPLANSTILPSTSDSTTKLDTYVPVTDSVVPDDIGPEDDVLDFYGEEPDSPIEKSAPGQDVPLDLEEEEEQNASHPTEAVQMSRSQSQPTTRAPKPESSGGPRSHSVYLPGYYDDSDEGYQGGTVTIVRSSR